MAKKKTRPKQPEHITRLRVERDSDYSITRHGDPNDRWSGDDSSTRWTVNGLRLSDDEYGDVTADFVVEPGDQLYLVYAVYSTGDSFGHSESGSIDFISVHRTRELAEANKNSLKQKQLRDKKGNYDWVAPVRLDGGTSYPYHCPWLGYFESLSYIDVQQFTVGA